jgi:hypothetical protein
MFKYCLSFSLILILLLGLGLPAAADGPGALDWLRSKQAADGGFAGDSDEASSLGATVEAVFAIVSLGEDPNAWSSSEGNTPVAFLQTKAAEVTLPGDIAKTLLAAVAAKANPRDFGGVDLIAALEAQYDPASGLYGGPELGNVFGQSLAILALTATGQEAPQAAVDWLLSAQLDDGSWSWNGETTPGSGDSNSAAIALQALQAGDYSSDAVANALAYFAAQQNEDGGFTYQKPSDFGTATDANSTAYAIQALLAAGEDLSDWAKDGLTPLDALLALQKESGAFQWQTAIEDENYLATVQAIPALANRSFAQVAGSIEAGPPAQLPESGGVPVLPLWIILSGLGFAGAGWAIKRKMR